MLGLKPWHGLLDGSSSSSFAAWPPSLGHLRTDSALPDAPSQLVGVVSLVTGDDSNPPGGTTDSTGLDLDGIDEGKDLLSFIAVCCSDGCGERRSIGVGAAVNEDNFALVAVPNPFTPALPRRKKAIDGSIRPAGETVFLGNPEEPSLEIAQGSVCGSGLQSPMGGAVGAPSFTTRNIAPTAPRDQHIQQCVQREPRWRRRRLFPTRPFCGRSWEQILKQLPLQITQALKSTRHSLPSLSKIIPLFKG